MEKIIYFITTALVLSDLDTYMLAGMDAKWVYWNLGVCETFTNKRALDFSNALVYNRFRKVIGCNIRFVLSKMISN